MKIISALSGLLLALGIIYLADHYYKSDIQNTVIQKTNFQTSKTEGEAIEKSQQINADVNQLSDAAVDAGLRHDFRPENHQRDQQVIRMQGLPDNTPGQDRYSRNQAASPAPQPPVPLALPKGWRSLLATEPEPEQEELTDFDHPCYNIPDCETDYEP